jgi:hypothetical protein
VSTKPGEVQGAPLGLDDGVVTYESASTWDIGEWAAAADQIREKANFRLAGAIRRFDGHIHE